MNLLYATPIDFKVRLLTYLPGLEIARSRSLSKHMLSIIDLNDGILYEERMRIEYPKRHLQYYTDCPYRFDWKNVYVITDQYAVAKRRIPIHKEIIEGRKCFLINEQIMLIFENIIGLVTGLTNFVKIGIFGFSASRAAIQEFMRSNPGKSLQEALIALGRPAPPQITLDNNF